MNWKPRPVRLGSKSEGVMNGTELRSVTWLAIRVAGLWLQPIRQTAPSWMAFVACVPATSGLLWLS
jgi:hypothetical protein